MKKYLRKNDKPLEQLINRLHEERRSVSHHNNIRLRNGDLRLFRNHSDGPLPNNCTGKLFKSRDACVDCDLYQITVYFFPMLV